MISQTLRLPFTVALAAALLAAAFIVLLTLGHSQAGTSQAGGSDGAMAVDCDLSQSGVQSECSYPADTTFQVEVHVTQPPADGYFLFQAKLEWTEGVVNYLPTVDAADEALWSNCTFVHRANNWENIGVPSVLIACSPLPALTVGDTFTGAVFTFEFQCKSAPAAASPPAGLAPNQSVLDLVSSVNETAPSQGGTIFVGAGLQPIAPALTDATVTCGEEPAPTPIPLSPPATLMPTPTPLSPPATPSASGAMAVDCDASQSGVQSACSYPPGSSFQVEIHVTQPPADGYFHIQAKLGWTEGMVNYLPTSSPSDEALWPNCTIAARVNNWAAIGVPSVFVACAPLPSLTVGDTFTGAIFTFEFRCKSDPIALSRSPFSHPPSIDPGQFALDLISSVNETPPSQGGTVFVGAGLQPIAPALTGATIACGEVAPTPTPLSPPATPNLSGAMAVDCDASQDGVQSECNYPPGSSFQVEVHVTQPPADGYFQIQAKLGWTEGVVNYLPVAASDEALWSNCTIAARVNNWEVYGVPSVFLGCAPLPSLSVGDTFIGAVFTFEFQCKGAPEALSPPAGLAPNQSVLDLISSVNEPAPSQGGTIFVGAGLQPIDPALTGATVTCGEPPAPTSTPPPPGPGGQVSLVSLQSQTRPVAEVP